MYDVYTPKQHNIIDNEITVKVYGETQILTGAYTCTAGSSDTCTMRCNDEKEAKEVTISCGNAGECYYYCNERKCNENGIIDASNTNNFYLIQTSNADECLKGATINLPNNGNAYFSTSSGTNKPFKDAIIQQGTNTGNITINIDSNTNSADAMKNTKIYASNAETLVIDIGSNQEIDTVYIECPDYPPSNPYTGLLIAPCIIDGSNGAIFSGDNQIVAPNGYPLGVWIPNGFTDGSETWINCDGRVDDLNDNQGYWDYIDTLSSNSNCYWTGNPTPFPTSSPIILTTTSPTITPSKSPITPNPTTATPTTSSPTTSNPTTSTPTTSIPTTSRPTTTNPTKVTTTSTVKTSSSTTERQMTSTPSTFSSLSTTPHNVDTLDTEEIASGSVKYTTTPLSAEIPNHILHHTTNDTQWLIVFVLSGVVICMCVVGIIVFIILKAKYDRISAEEGDLKKQVRPRMTSGIQFKHKPMNSESNMSQIRKAIQHDEELNDDMPSEPPQVLQHATNDGMYDDGDFIETGFIQPQTLDEIDNNFYENGEEHITVGCGEDFNLPSSDSEDNETGDIGGEYEEDENEPDNDTEIVPIINNIDGTRF